MRSIGWDVESYLIGPGVPAPKLVCLSWDDGDGSPQVVLREEAIKLFNGWIRDPDVELIAHHAPFDLSVMAAEDPSLVPWIFRGIDEGRIRCTKVREMLLQNAIGELKFEFDEDLQEYKRTIFTLQHLVWRYLKVFIKKGEDTWRLRYSELDGVPIAQWPQEAIDYSISDSTHALGIYLHQDLFRKEKIPFRDAIPGEVETTQAAWALALMRLWGVRTDGEMVAKLKVELTSEYNAAIVHAQSTGMVRGNGTRDMSKIKAAVTKFFTERGVAVPLSDSGKNISTSRETLRGGTMGLTPSPDLLSVSEVVRIQKLLKTYVPVLERGAHWPINPEWNYLVESFRTSCAKPNLQNPPRAGGVRECFIPRPGHVFAFADYSTLEMRTLAQVCIDLFKYSMIADAIREGRDLHVELAAFMLGIGYDSANARYLAGDKEMETARQFCKIGNYGFGGGMGAKAFVDYARSYGIHITLKMAGDLHKAFRERWREMAEYFNYCGALCGAAGEAESLIYQRTGLVRGKVGYTATCNHHFQHLAAVGAKSALYQVARECYLIGYGSPLYGCRPVIFAHDEIIMEIPEDRFGPAKTGAAALRLSEVMVSEMQRWVPNVPVEAGATMARRWLKGAKPVYAGGLLVPGKKVGKEWVHDACDQQRLAA